MMRPTDQDPPNNLNDALLAAADFLLINHEPLEHITTLHEIDELRDELPAFSDDFCNYCSTLMIFFCRDLEYIRDNLYDYILDRATERI